MRVLLSVLSCMLMTVSIARADDLTGSWTYANAATGETISVTFNADGTGDFDGDPIKYVRNGEQLIVAMQDGQFVYTIQVKGDTLLASGGDLEGRLAFIRKGSVNDVPANNEQPAGNPLEPAPVQAKTGATIVGTWTDGQGQIVFNVDGSCDYVGQKARYEYDGVTLKIHGSAGDAEMKVTIDGDTFIAAIGDQVQKLSRVKAGPQQKGASGVDSIAGVYVYSEASVDPTNVMVITQYLTLYPDGTIGWFKTELGASRTQVTDCLERFASFKTNPQNKGRTYGTWQADTQGNVSLQWTIWNNLQCSGRIDRQTGKLTIEKMGILSEGATLTYERQQ